jgi:hypothetical protein
VFITAVPNIKLCSWGEVKLTLFLEARAGVALTQDLEGRPNLGELLRDTALGRDDGLREMLGLLVLRGGRRRGGHLTPCKGAKP